MSQELSSSKLLDLAKNGDAESLGLLMRRYFRYLNALSMSHIDERIRMRVAPSDIVQETLLEAHRDFEAFAGTSTEEFTGWLRKILFNNLSSSIERHVLTAKRDIRKQLPIEGQRKDLKASGLGLLGTLYDNTIPSASSAMRHEESLEQLMNAITCLPEDYQQIIRMRHFEGLTFNQISVKLNRKPGASRMLWFRAVQKLKGLLKEEGN